MSATKNRIDVLHVDDDPPLTKLVADMLERENDQFSVEAATSASEALDRFAANDFDCVISDYDMPGQNGIEFLETLREENPDLPFILYTGKGSEEVASDAISSGATDYLQKRSGTDQYALLANRIQNAVDQYHNKQRRITLERIRDLVYDINQALIRASSREEIETKVCEVLASSDIYQFAAVAEVGDDSKHIQPRTWAGIGEGFLDEFEMSIEEGSPGRQAPGGRAFHRREIAVAQEIRTDPTYEPWRELALEHGFEALAVVPLEYETTLYGLLALFGNRPYAFDETEQELLVELSEDISHALDGIESRRKFTDERDQRAALFENTPDPIMEVEFDGQTPIITDVNTAFEKTFGFEASETIGQAVHEVVVPDIESEEHEKLKQQVFKQDPVESIVRRETEGGIREFRLRIIPTTKGDVSKGAYAWYTEVTDQKDRERVLGDLHDVTRKFMRASSPEEIASLAIDAGQEILGLPYTHFYTISDDGQRLHPLAATEEMYDRFGDLPTFPRGEGLFWGALEAGSIQQYDDVQDEDDLASTLPFRGAIISPVGDYGVFASGSLEPADFDAFDRELASILITQMEAALDAVRRRETLQAHERELERQNERLEEFAGVVSHDLRNPLNVAEGRVGLAREEFDSDHLDVAEEALDRMDRLIERTLTLAQSGQVVGETEAVNLSDLTEQCWQNVDTAGSTLRSDGVPEIEADQERLENLFENLYRNAVEHGGEEVTVTIGGLADGFYVEDDGKGIPEDERKDIFETGYTTNEDGTGFGLSIVKEIVEAHNWDIRVVKGSEGGVRFEITGVDFADV